MKLTWKKVALGVPLLFALYVAVGVGLIATNRIGQFYFLPGWSIKGPHADRSGVAVDGPIIYRQDSLLISKALVPAGAGVAIRTDTLRRGARLPSPRATCFVDATGQQFNVPLTFVPAVPEDTYSLPDRLLVLSDIEGNFKGFSELLRGVGVVDEQLNWRFGQGQLVLVGDFFDRGLNVTECLWLIYKLEQQSWLAGGQVHFILGNHERMNLTGHYKYVRRKYRANADTLGLPYARWYDRRSVLGHWLRTKNVVEKIGTLLFVHGGISPELAGKRLTLRQLNDLARASLDTPATALPALAQLATQPPGSPDWYRGLAQKEPTRAQVEQVLAIYDASAMVIGHTPVEAITPLYDGRVIAIDLPHQQRTDAGQPLEALLWQDNRWQVADSRGKRRPL